MQEAENQPSQLKAALQINIVLVQVTRATTIYHCFWKHPSENKKENVGEIFTLMTD
jgi:hypothetical protein